MPKIKNEKKNNVIYVRLDDKQAALLNDYRQLRGLSVGEAVRMLINDLNVSNTLKTPYKAELLINSDDNTPFLRILCGASL